MESKKYSEETAVFVPSKCTFEELISAAQPMLNLLYKYYDPHTSIIIEMGFIKVVQDKMGAPLDIRD
jgi:hypothetical protein